MSNGNLESYIDQKILALKERRKEVDDRINQVAASLLAEKKEIEAEIKSLQSLVKDFKDGVDPGTVKVDGRRGPRTK